MLMSWQVSGVYDGEAGLYRWAEMTSFGLSQYHKESDPQAYAAALLESRLHKWRATHLLIIMHNFMVGGIRTVHSPL